MSRNKRIKGAQKIGLVDVDLLNNRTCHPNLVLLNINWVLHDNDIPFNLIFDPNADLTSISKDRSRQVRELLSPDFLKVFSLRDTYHRIECCQRY